MIFTFLRRTARAGASPGGILAGLSLVVWILLLPGIGLAASSPAEALRSALDSYDPASARASRTEAADAFFLFEDSSLDRDLAVRDPSLYRTIESEWAAVLSEMGRSAPAEEVRARGERVLDLLRQARESTASGGSVFVDSLLIILREGFEAILVVSALAAWLRRVGQTANVPYLYGGSALAVVASIGLWVAARTVIEISGIGREALEGWTMLLAAVVLFWVSYWLVSKVGADRWQVFVRARAERAVSRGAILGFGVLSFVVVFREGFETVLFYEALSARAGGASGQSLLLGGFVTGLALLGAFYASFLRLGPKIPMRAFFAVTGALLYFMAFKFAGAGIFELQVAQALSQTPVAFFPDSLFLREWLGMYPYA
ncbi:MAG: FTR1 family iron permease, partial [Candidatus Binatia bacterium]